MRRHASYREGEGTAPVTCEQGFPRRPLRVEQNLFRVELEREIYIYFLRVWLSWSCFRAL